MKFLPSLVKLALEKSPTPVHIGLGVRDTSLEFLETRLGELREFLCKHPLPTVLHLYTSSPLGLATSFLEENEDLIRVEEDPQEVSRAFRDLRESRIAGMIRGTLPSSLFIQSVKTFFGKTRTSRLALMETASGYPFWFGPVGIDEDSPAHKRDFVQHGSVLLSLLDLPPRVRLLSAGRMGDVNRDAKIRENIEGTIALVNELARESPGIEVQHGEILIEKAIADKVGIIIAPEGVSGNLIYRTLVHLGGGCAYGAPYLGLEYPVLDTSRLANLSELLGSICLIHLLQK